MDREYSHIDWIDALKGFGIFCVTLGHLAPWLPLETHIYSFHMCLFFFISGYLFKQVDLGVYLRKKFKSILVPFFVWDFLSSLLSLYQGQSIDILVSRFFILNGELCWNAPIWFLLVLFIAECLYASLMSIKNSRLLSVFILVISAVLWILVGSRIWPLKLNLVPLALFFFSLGDLTHKASIIHPKKYPQPIKAICIILTGLLSIVFGVLLNPQISYTAGVFGNIYYCIVAAVAGTFFYVGIFKNCRRLAENKVLRVLGKNSLIIMVTQYWFFTFYGAIFLKMFNVGIWGLRNTPKAFILAFVTCALTTAFVSLFKKAFKNHPQILNLAKYAGIR